MSRIILQPAGGREAQKHYKETILKPVSLDRIQKFIKSEEHEILENIYPTGYAPTWGVVPGGNNININKWRRIQKGFVTLFSGQNKIFASGVVTYTLHSSGLASEL